MQQQAHGITDMQYSGVLPPFLHQKRYLIIFIILQGFFTYNLCESFYGLEQIIKNFVCWKSQCIFNLCIKRIKLPKTLTR